MLDISGLQDSESRQHVGDLSLGTARLTLADLAGLAIGDVVVLDRTDDQPLDLHVGDRPALRGRFAESTAAIAIAIVN